METRRARTGSGKSYYSMLAGGIAASILLSACGGGGDNVASIAPPSTPAANIAQIDSGTIEGVIETGRVSFKGIPYAQAPVGNLRWKPPQPAKSWQGTRPAKQFGNDCMQTVTNANTVGTSEDCLYINVFKPTTAKPGDKLPVRVWIHGGGFAFGASSDPIYDNPGDPKEGIVYVNFNYRVNVFGFLAHPGLTAESPDKASGNYGLMDQIAALKWVRSNIAQFGGDPDNVTLNGESAGASSIGYLLVSPLAKGLFKRVIMQSTYGFHPQKTLAQAEQWSVQRYGSDIAALRALPASQVLKMNVPASGIAIDAPIYGNEDWEPNIDGLVLKKSIRQAWKDGDFSTADMMIGDNENEGYLFMMIRGPLVTPEQKTVANFQSLLRSTYAESPEEALSVYPVASDNDVLEQLSFAYGDAAFHNSSREMSRYMVTRTPNVYRYLFTKHSASPYMINGKPVATHFDEVPYVFGGVSTGEKYAPSDVATSIAMQEAWRRFIKTGNPNGGKVVWPAYDATDPHLEFGDAGQTIGAGHRNAALDLVLKHLDVIEPLH